MAHDAAGPRGENLALRGWGTMAGVLSLVAVGSSNLPQAARPGEQGRRGNAGVAYGAFGAAAALHLLGVYDAVRTVDRGRTFTVVPERGGASAEVAWRF